MAPAFDAAAWRGVPGVPCDTQDKLMPDAIDIDRIVREVAARLRGMERPAAPAAPKKGELAIAARVVTLDQVAGRLGGVARVRVDRAAVVTPAVRDHLADNGVELVRHAQGERPHAAHVACRLAIAAVQTPITAEAMLRELAGDGESPAANGRVARESSLPAAVGRLGDWVKHEGLPAVLLTKKTSAAACLANRRSGVRAVVVDRADEGESQFRQVGANLLVFDPQRFGPRERTALVEMFRAGAPWACPAELQAELS